MNELVKKLTARSPIQVNRPDTNVTALLERIDLKYLHVMFLDTSTEIGIQLDETRCDFANADFKLGRGKMHCEGVVTLNSNKVRCIVDFDLQTMFGYGSLEPIEDESAYRAVLTSNKKVLI
jgi:hypothetical protein